MLCMADGNHRIHHAEQRRTSARTQSCISDRHLFQRYCFLRCWPLSRASRRSRRDGLRLRSELRRYALCRRGATAYFVECAEYRHPLPRWSSASRAATSQFLSGRLFFLSSRFRPRRRRGLALSLNAPSTSAELRIRVLRCQYSVSSSVSVLFISISGSASGITWSVKRDLP